MKDCKLVGCKRPLDTLGWCRGHYQRWYRTGSVGTVEIVKRVRKQCSVVGCKRQSRENGMCSRHYGHIRHYGRILEHTKFDPRPAILHGPVAYIPLNIDARDGFAVVDAADSWVDRYKWTRDKYGYAVASLPGEV
jgi:hypothetical protein